MSSRTTNSSRMHIALLNRIQTSDDKNMRLMWATERGFETKTKTKTKGRGMIDQSSVNRGSGIVFQCFREIYFE